MSPMEKFIKIVILEYDSFTDNVDIINKQTLINTHENIYESQIKNFNPHYIEPTDIKDIYSKTKIEDLKIDVDTQQIKVVARIIMSEEKYKMNMMNIEKRHKIINFIKNNAKKSLNEVKKNITSVIKDIDSKKLYKFIYLKYKNDEIIKKDIIKIYLKLGNEEYKILEGESNLKEIMKETSDNLIIDTGVNIIRNKNKKDKDIDIYYQITPSSKRDEILINNFERQTNRHLRANQSFTLEREDNQYIYNNNIDIRYN